MDWALLAYWICFFTGTTYALISALLSGLFGFFGAGGGEAGVHFDVGHDYGAGGHLDGGHGDAFSTEAGGEPVIAPLSPATIAIFMATFGGVGIILTSLFHFSLFLTLPIATATAFMVAGLVFLLFYRLFTAVQASSEPHMAEAIGLTAEVTVPIPKDGLGEVAFVVRSNRLSLPARSQEGVDIPRHAAVRIVRQVGSALYVALLNADESGPAASPTETQQFKD